MVVEEANNQSSTGHVDLNTIGDVSDASINQDARDSSDLLEIFSGEAMIQSPTDFAGFAELDVTAAVSAVSYGNDSLVQQPVNSEAATTKRHRTRQLRERKPYGRSASVPSRPSYRNVVYEEMINGGAPIVSYDEPVQILIQVSTVPAVESTAEVQNRESMAPNETENELTADSNVLAAETQHDRSGLPPHSSEETVNQGSTGPINPTVMATVSSNDYSSVLQPVNRYRKQRSSSIWKSTPYERLPPVASRQIVSYADITYESQIDQISSNDGLCRAEQPANEVSIQVSSADNVHPIPINRVNEVFRNHRVSKISDSLNCKIQIVNDTAIDRYLHFMRR